MGTVTKETRRELLTRAKVYCGCPGVAEASYLYQFGVLVEQGLLPEHTLLEVGAGYLGIGKMLIDYLEDGNYWAIEPNDWLTKASGVKRSRYHLWAFDDFKLSRTGHRFDFVLAHSIFTHADRLQIRTIVAEALAVLVPGGLLVASFYDQDCGDSEHVGWMYPNGVAYTAEFIVGLAKEAGFVDIRTVTDPRHPVKHTWLFGRVK